jgi:hypothetical protein
VRKPSVDTTNEIASPMTVSKWFSPNVHGVGSLGIKGVPDDLVKLDAVADCSGSDAKHDIRLAVPWHCA